MGIDAITKRNDGRDAAPVNDAEWQDWVSATKTRNFVEQDPVLDWLDLYGESRGFQRDDELPSYDPRTDFVQFIFTKGQEFESAVVGHLQSILPITVISQGPEDIRSISKARDTFEAMEAGERVIAQGVLWNPEDQTFGAPDLLVRSDVLLDLFPDALSADEAALLHQLRRTLGKLGRSRQGHDQQIARSPGRRQRRLPSGVSVPVGSYHLVHLPQRTFARVRGANDRSSSERTRFQFFGGYVA